jgi:predicted permease
MKTFTVNAVQAVWGDIGVALRRLRNNPGFSAVAVLTLALCIGANLAIFAVVDAILLKPLPFPEPDRLVTVFNCYPGAGVERSAASYPNYFERREAIKAFSSVSLWQDGSTTVGGEGTPQRVPIGRITPDFFATLGVPLAMGHAFTDADLTYQTDMVAILTDGFWRSRFNADPLVLGRKFLNDGLSITVVGVLPRGFQFLSSRAEFFRPASQDPKDRLPIQRHSNNYNMIARLAPGATLAEAQAQLDALNEQQTAELPYAKDLRAARFQSHIRPLHQDYVRAARPTLLLLQSGVLLLLLIGSVNLVNLLLIRAHGRAKELAVRRALGAGRLDIAREVLAETLLIAAGGGLGGLMLGAAGIRLLRALGTDHLPLGASVGFDARVAATALAGALLMGVLLAVPIIWFNLRTRLAPVLQAETRGGTVSPAAQRLRHAFIVAQVALAFVLLAGAGFLGISLKRVLDTSPGFNPAHILAGSVALPWKDYRTSTNRTAFIQRLLPAIRALPGVTDVAITMGLPFNGQVNDSVTFVEGYIIQPGESIRAHYQVAASSDYWRLMGIPLIRGRVLEDRDIQLDPPVCVVDEAFARRYWPGADPIGRRISRDIVFNQTNAFTVVGVVGNVKQSELAETADHGTVYFPYTATYSAYFALLVRTPLPPATMAPTIRKAIFQLDPALPIDDLKLMQVRIDDSLIARRSPAILAVVFAGFALLLSAVGTYGVLAYAVSQRRREIGVRVALGALPGQIRRQFLNLGLRLLLVGTVLGIGGAWVAARTMQNILYGIQPPLQLATLVGTALVMGLVSLTACVVPSLRASHIPPMEALRCE